VWDPPESLDGGSDIDMAVWALLEDLEEQRPNPVAFSVAVSDDRQWSSIGLAGERSDGHTHVQIVQAGRGTGWVVERLEQLYAQWKPASGVAVAPGSPAGSLIPKIESAGVEVLRCSPRDWRQACGMFDDAITERSQRHMGQPQLNVAVGAAKRSKAGDAHEFDGTPDVDIAPLRATILAMFALARPHATTKRAGRVW
jgi:hypothetical protein